MPRLTLAYNVRSSLFCFTKVMSLAELCGIFGLSYHRVGLMCVLLFVFCFWRACHCACGCGVFSMSVASVLCPHEDHDWRSSMAFMSAWPLFVSELLWWGAFVIRLTRSVGCSAWNCILYGRVCLSVWYVDVWTVDCGRVVCGHEMSTIQITITMTFSGAPVGVSLTETAIRRLSLELYPELYPNPQTTDVHILFCISLTKQQVTGDVASVGFVHNIPMLLGGSPAKPSPQPWVWVSSRRSLGGRRFHVFFDEWCAFWWICFQIVGQVGGSKT